MSDQYVTKPQLDEAVEEIAVITHKALEAELTPIRSDIAELKADVSDLKGNVSDLKGSVKSLETGQKAILNVVQSIDQQLQTHKDLPTRMNRVENAVFG